MQPLPGLFYSCHLELQEQSKVTSTPVVIFTIPLSEGEKEFWSMKNKEHR